MRRPPRRADDGIVGWSMLWRGLAQGGCLLVAAFAVYVAALQTGQSTDLARTLAVVSLTAGNLLLVAANVSAGGGLRALAQPGARAFWFVFTAASAALAVAVLVPGPQRLLHFEVPEIAELSLALLFTAAFVGAGVAASRCIGRQRLQFQ
jgi:Ca2+-transporting ATPase